MIKKRTQGQQQQGRRPFNAQRRNYTSVYDNMSYGAFSQSNASSYNPRGGLKFGFRGGNRGGFRKFTPGFRGGRGFNRGGYSGSQRGDQGGYSGSQRGDQYSENSSNFSRGGFRGGFGGCKNLLIFLNV